MGASVALSGSLCISGAPMERDPVTSETLGAAYVHVQGSPAGDWMQSAKLQPGDLTDQDRFGASVAFDNDLLLVGAPSVLASTTQPGRAYLYQTPDGGQSWTLLTTLTSSDGMPADLFGQAVALDEDWILIGAPGHDLSGSQTGSAYLFERVGGTWTETQKLSAQVPDPNDQFGDSVALDGSTAVVGASRKTGTAINSGSVSVYRRASGSYALEQVISPSDGAIADLFGASVDVQGDLLVCGAPGDDDAGGGSGSIYLFRESSGVWTQEDKLIGSSVGFASAMGQSVATDGLSVAAGAPGGGTGMAYVFQLISTTWTEVRSIRPILQTPASTSGTSVRIEGDLLALGDAGDDTAQFNTGATFLIAVDGVDSNNNGMTDACESFGTSVCGTAVLNSTGMPGTIQAKGSPFAGDRLLQVTATNLPNLQFGYFLASQTAGLTMGPGGSQGNLCLGGTIGRFVAQVGNTQLTGSLEISVDTANMPAPLAASISAGQTWLFQAWFRDVNPMATSNFTDAVEIEFQ